jgi:hypothetical protein
MTSCGAEPSGARGAVMRRDHCQWMRIFCHGMQFILLDLEEKPKCGLLLVVFEGCCSAIGVIGCVNLLAFGYKGSG